jgi:putative spermidine/putrescine transport system ATP-binding protein
MDVAGNIAYPLKLRHVPSAECIRRVDAALELVQLKGYGARSIDALSGGQRQRVALARALVFEPRIVLMDEPLSALDKQLRERMQMELRQLHERLGTTTVYVTHDQREALTMSDRIAVINGGRIIQLGAPREIYDRPATRFVAEFIGESSFLPVTRSDANLVCCDVPLRLANTPPTHTRMVVLVRPERVRILSTGGGADGLNVFDATVEQIVYQGDSVLVQGVLGDGSRIGARASAGDEAFAGLRPGARVSLGLRPEDTVLVADG